MMKRKKIICLFFIGLVIGLGNIWACNYSRPSDSFRLQLAKHGSDNDDDSGSHSRRRHGDRHSYYFNRKIYYYPERKYYYFYDYYPQNRVFYPQDKESLVYNPDYIPITVIVDMAAQGIPDVVIISEIERTHSVYYLSSETITYLKQHNVSDKIIDYMLEAKFKY